MKQLVNIVLLVTVAISGVCDAQVRNVTMSGFVTDKKSRPLEGARVTIIGNKAKADITTDSDGAFVVTFAQGVEEGNTVRIQIEKPGYKPYEKWLAVSSAIPLRVSLESIRSTPSDRKPTPAPQRPPAPSKSTPVGLNGTSGGTTIVPGTVPAQPPMFSEANDKFNIVAGTDSLTMKNGDSSCLVSGGSTCFVKGYAEQGNFVVDAELFSAPGHGSVRLVKNVLHKDIPEWDRCFDATTLEIVDDKLTPVYQMVYTTPNDIVIFGLFRIQEYVYILSNHGISYHSANEAVTEEEYPIKTIFKYPSRIYHCNERNKSSQTENLGTVQYGGLTNVQLCDVVLTKATEMFKIADQCLRDLEDTVPKKESDDVRNQIRRKFSDEFVRCCLQVVRNLHQELVFRLKPLDDSKGEDLLHELEMERERNPTGIILSTVEDTSAYFRNMCSQLVK